MANPTGNDVWVLTYTHKHGIEVSIRSTELGAYRAAAQNIIDDVREGRIEDSDTVDQIRTAWSLEDDVTVVRLANAHWMSFSHQESYDIERKTVLP